MGKIRIVKVTFDKAREQESERTRNRAKELRGRLEAKLAAQDSIERFAELAKYDPEARDMLGELCVIERAGL